MDMKICIDCSIAKSLNEFHRKTNSKDGRQPRCKQCSTNKRSQWYKNNSSKSKKSNRKRAFDRRQKIVDYLKEHPCIDCGEEDPIVLQFDHIRDKKIDISNMVGRNGWEIIQEEIAKCVVRCANCHTRKTAKEQKWYLFKG
jgi:hypothetical protein